MNTFSSSSFNERERERKEARMVLPFERVEEAEVCLGRELGFAEELWLEYSSTKSDYILYCHNTLFLLSFYTLLPLPYIILQLFNIHRFKIQPNIQISFSDILDCYFKVFFTFLLALAPLQIFSYPLIQMIGIRTNLPLPSCTEMGMQLLVYFVVEDYCSYWLHRLLHQKWWYHYIHHIHHQYTAPIAFAAPHAHWAEIIILGFASFLGPFIVPGHMITFWLWMILRQTQAIEAHSGYEFPWSPWKLIPFYGGAAYHDYHHFVGGKGHTNFASVFTYCDFIYGTNKGYRYKKETEKTRNIHKQVLSKLEALG